MTFGQKHKKWKKIYGTFVLRFAPWNYGQSVWTSIDDRISLHSLQYTSVFEAISPGELGLYPEQIYEYNSVTFSETVAASPGALK